MIIVWVCAGIVIACVAPFVASFAWDIWAARGVRGLLATLTPKDGPEPDMTAPEPTEAAVERWLEWWLDAEKRRLPKPWEPAPVAATAGVPPWHPDAPSLTTGAGLYDLRELRRLIGREES